MKPLPRAAPGGTVALDAELYNYIAENLERLDKWTVRPPLNFQQTPAGNLLSLASDAGEMVVVAIIGTETGGGRYQGTILGGNSTGPVTDIFQLDPTTGQSSTDGPAPQLHISAYVNNALVMNLPEQYVAGSHVLWAGNVVHPIYAVGRIVGQTNESPPRARVYINDWTIHPVIAQITYDLTTGSVPQGAGGGIYTGKIIQGHMADASNTYNDLLTTTVAGHLPSADNCWIMNIWEQTNVFPQGATAGSTILPVGTVVNGFTAGFPLYAWDGSGRQPTLGTFYMVYTWTPPQMPLLSPAVHAITTGGTASASYTTIEQGMINNLKTDVTNLQASLKQLYLNLQNCGYSK
jgi:hypothetical protein